MIEISTKNPRQSFFDELATSWNDNLTAENEIFIKTIIEKANTIESIGKKVLDLGCGRGVLFPFLKDWEVVAFDISEEMLRQARLRACQNVVKYVQGDAHNLPFPSNYFAKVLMLSVFPHFDNPQKVLQEIYRVLKHEGIGILIHLMDAHKVNEIHRSIGGAVKNDTLPEPYELLKLINNKGFDIIYENFDGCVAVIFKKPLVVKNIIGLSNSSTIVKQKEKVHNIY